MAIETSISSKKNTQNHLLLDRDEVLARRKKYWALRRAQDVLLSLLALSVLWPLMLITAIVIYIESPGASPIFVQNRIGRDGKVFKFYKFRSMIPDAEARLAELMDENEMEGPAFKMKDDPRITKIGKFIRRSSIDELPQRYVCPPGTSQRKTIYRP